MFTSPLFIRDSAGNYLEATANDVFEAARQAIDERYPYMSHCFNDPASAKEYFTAKLQGLEHEVFGIAFLTTQHQLIAYSEMFRGTLNQTSVYPREVVKEALRLNAAACVLTHNHPSGCNEPSNADLKCTKNLQDALGTIEVRILDHIIVAGKNTYSFAENGLI